MTTALTFSAAALTFSAAALTFSAAADPSLSDRRTLRNRESADHDTPNKPPPKGDPFPTRKAQNLLAHVILPLFQMAELGSASSGGGAAIFCRVFPTLLSGVRLVAAPPPNLPFPLFRSASAKTRRSLLRPDSAASAPPRPFSV